MDLAITNLDHSYQCYCALTRIAAAVANAPPGRINVDCSAARFISSGMTAHLQVALAPWARSIAFTNLRPEVKVALAKNGLFREKVQERGRTTIPLTKFHPSEAKRFAAYSGEHLRDKGIPRMSQPLEAKFFESIDELFQNCALHSKADLVFSCGQLFPKMRVLEFAIADTGIGIAKSLERIGKFYRPDRAIEWAMHHGTSRIGDVPGGLGLKIIREFIELNGGEITVVSDQGFWQMRRRSSVAKLLPFRFPGTAVTLKVDTSDTNFYDFATPIDPGSIF